MANRNDSNGKSAMCVSPLIPQTLLSQRVNRSSQQAHQSKENAFIHRWGIASIRCGNGLEKTPSVPFMLVSLFLTEDSSLQPISSGKRKWLSESERPTTIDLQPLTCWASLASKNKCRHKIYRTSIKPTKTGRQSLTDSFCLGSVVLYKHPKDSPAHRPHATDSWSGWRFRALL